MNRFAGVLLALGGIVLWGLFPIYWKLLTHLDAFEVLAHRILWSVPFLGLVLYASRELGQAWHSFRQPGKLKVLIFSSLMITFNWGMYIWAVGVNKVVEASMGYFLSPLMSVVLGLTVFHERLRRAQWLAVAIATLAVLSLFVTRDVPPWLALGLGASFASYSALRKIASQDSVTGLFVETLLLAPFALGFIVFLWLMGQAGFTAHGLPTLSLALASGIVTATPLILFVAGGRRMPLSSAGLLFYLTPTIQFLIGIFLYHEPLPPVELAAFAAIWLALAIFASDSYVAGRASQTRLSEKAR